MDAYFTDAADRQCKGWVLHGHPHSCFFRYHTFVSGRVKATWKARSVHSRQPSRALRIISPRGSSSAMSPCIYCVSEQSRVTGEKGLSATTVSALMGREQSSHLLRQNPCFRPALAHLPCSYLLFHLRRKETMVQSPCAAFSSREWTSRRFKGEAQHWDAGANN